MRRHDLSIAAATIVLVAFAALAQSGWNGEVAMFGSIVLLAFGVVTWLVARATRPSCPRWDVTAHVRIRCEVADAGRGGGALFGRPLG